MTRREYERRTNAEWEGTTVRTRREITNGFMTIPAGAVCTIHAKFKGFTLRSEPCATCGVRVSVSRVHPADVEVFRP